MAECANERTDLQHKLQGHFCSGNLSGACALLCGHCHEFKDVLSRYPDTRRTPQAGDGNYRQMLLRTSTNGDDSLPSSDRMTPLRIRLPTNAASSGSRTTLLLAVSLDTSVAQLKSYLRSYMTDDVTELFSKGRQLNSDNRTLRQCGLHAYSLLTALSRELPPLPGGMLKTVSNESDSDDNYIRVKGNEPIQFMQRPAAPSNQIVTSSASQIAMQDAMQEFRKLDVRLKGPNFDQNNGREIPENVLSDQEEQRYAELVEMIAQKQVEGYGDSDHDEGKRIIFEQLVN